MEPRLRSWSAGKPQRGGKIVRFAKGSEQAVPPGDVAKVEFVDVEFVVNGVVLGPLREIAEPAGCANVAVVEVFAEDGENVEPRGAG